MNKSLRRTKPQFPRRILTVAVAAVLWQQKLTSPETPSAQPQPASATPPPAPGQGGVAVKPAKVPGVATQCEPVTHAEEKAELVIGSKLDIAVFGSKFAWLFGGSAERFDKVSAGYAPDGSMHECIKQAREDLADGTDHVACTYSQGGASLIVFWRAHHVGLIAHEALHAVSAVLRHVNILQCEETEEVYAYMLQELVMKIQESANALS